MNRFPLVLSSLALGLALAGCGSTSSSSSAPRGAEVTEADATAFRQSETEKQLRQQVSPPLDEPLRVLEFAEPRYPSFLLSDSSREARGKVVVSFEVLPSGHVGAAKALPGSNEALHKPAVEAIRRWRFSPPVRDGKPARLYLQHTFHMEP
ncbi:MAG: TonB family protein [Acidovorax sp.]|nr:TonB family protein [Acidovorax sp.]